MTTTLIRGGTLADGDGGAIRRADVRFKDGTTIEVAAALTSHADETVVDATGLLVTPGFVDVHTHYDGQATWDEQLTPSCWHGITTIVMGNCGVGFAPVHPGQEQQGAVADPERPRDDGSDRWPARPECERRPGQARRANQATRDTEQRLFS